MVKEVNPSQRGNNKDLELPEDHGVAPMAGPTGLLPKIYINREIVREMFAIYEVISFKAGYLKFKTASGDTYERKGGTIAWRNNNPGNIKWGLFAKSVKAIAEGHGGHAIFATYADGVAAQKNLLFTDVRGYNKLSIKAAIAKYAPVSDPAFKNEPDKYAKFIAFNLNVPTSTILSDLSDEQQTEMIKIMSQYEGWKEGTTTKV